MAILLDNDRRVLAREDSRVIVLQLMPAEIVEAALRRGDFVRRDPDILTGGLGDLHLQLAFGHRESRTLREQFGLEFRRATLLIIGDRGRDVVADGRLEECGIERFRDLGGGGILGLFGS
nr:hypothetical protein [Burkholderia anthina]